MKKLILSLAIIYSNALSYSVLEEQLLASVNNCDVNKTSKLLGQIEELDQNLKNLLVNSAQNNVAYYQNASKFILYSSKDSVNFVLSALTMAGSYKLAHFCFKQHQEFEAAATVTAFSVELDNGIKHIASEVDRGFQEISDGIDNAVDGFFNFFKNKKGKKTTSIPKTVPFKQPEMAPTGLYNTFMNFAGEVKAKPSLETVSKFIAKIKSNPTQKLHLEIELKKWSLIAGIATSAVVGLYASYKLLSSLMCNAASEKLKDARVVYTLVSSARIKEIIKEN